MRRALRFCRNGAIGFLLFAYVACKPREQPATSEPDTKISVELPAPPEIPPLRKEFHVLQALIWESVRLETDRGAKDADQKSELLTVEIAKLARQLETTHHEMNAEEQRILTEGLSTLRTKRNE